MSVNCKYCNEPDDKQSKPGLCCEVCSCFIHIPCLRRQGTPGDFTCDVFFKFTCEDCSPEKKELFVRYKFSWVNVIYLTLHHLSNHSYGISHHGYFHYKTHICSFIDRYWQTLFGFSSKQKKNWVGTIAGVLSVYNKLFFKSGSVALGEAGWWRLLHNFSPAVAAHIIQEIAKDKPKNRPRSQPSMDRNHFLAKIAEMGYKELINDDVEDKPIDPAPSPAPAKKRRLDSDGSGSSFQPDYDTTRPDFLDNVKYEDTISTSEYVGAGYGELSHAADYALPASLAAPRTMQSDTSSVTSYQNIVYYDSDSRSGSDIDKKPPVEVKQKPVVEEKEVRRESLFSTELNSEGMPWLDQEYYEEVYNKKEESKTKEVTNIKEEHSKPKEDLVEMTPYEEVQLFKKIEGMIPKVKDPSKRAYLYRFRAKLRLRRLKRHKHLPLFDLDKLVKQLGGYATEDLSVAVNIERVLDRFQRSYLLDKLCGTISWSSGATLVSGGAAALRSPYSGALLKPYIRRDRAARPLWLRLTDELLRKTNKHIKGYEPPARPSLDYSYVQPHHIAAVNNLCAQFFWPGIDLTEALQYPEFSCVVTFGQLVVGCAFLVPDAGPQRAYVSFVLTRPEWRRAGIATFMLYHLLQTCTGQDVTLHVSPTNPAIFLYQKFGFKVEELIQDFYEKYYDIDYKGCRHALFLRLVR